MRNSNNREDRRWRPSRACRLLLLPIVIAMSGGCTDSNLSGNISAPTDGPVKFLEPEIKQWASVHAAAGDQVVFGATVMVNDGDADAVLNGARLIGDVDQTDAVVDEVRIIDLGKAPGSGDSVGVGKWPLDRAQARVWRSAEPIAGAEIASGHALGLVFLVDVRQTGNWDWPNTALDYEVGGVEYTAVTNFGFQTCPPEPAKCTKLH